MRLTDIQQLRAVGPGGAPLGPVQDVLLDLELGRNVYWLIDLGTAYDPAPVLISAAKGYVDKETVQVTLDQITLDEARAHFEAKTAEKPRRTWVPDIMPGMFGPLSGSTGLGMATLRASVQKAQVSKPANAPTNWRWGDEVLGRPLFGLSGELGKVRDVYLDPLGREMTYLELAEASGATNAIPAVALRHVPEDGDYLVAQVDSAGRILQNDPSLPESA